MSEIEPINHEKELSKPTKEIPVNTATSPKLKPKKTQPFAFSIDASVEKADIQLSLEEQEALRKYEARMALIKPLIDAIIPDKTPEKHLQNIANKFKMTADQLNDEDQGEARRVLRNAGFNKQQLINKITQTKVADQDLHEYVAALQVFATTIFPSGDELDFANIQEWVGICETTEQTQFYQGLAEKWKAKFIKSVDEKTTKQRMQDLQSLLVEITGCNTYPRPKPRNPQITSGIFTAFMELYEYAYSITNQRQKDDIDTYLINGAKKVGLIFNDPEQTKLMLQLYKEVVNYPNREIGKKFADAVSRYASHHGLSTEKVQGLVNKLLPAMQNNDPQVEILLKGGNIWGMQTGDFGVGDYLCHAYASPVTPGNLNELLLAAREVPATTLSRLEHNRLDALVMSLPFGVLRDFIHDQRPHVNDVLMAMVHYYDTGERANLESILPKADYFNSEDRVQTMFDKTRYDMNVEERAKPGIVIKSIDILRRLIENTKSTPDAPPITFDEQLNQKLQALEQEIINRGIVTRETLATTINYVNQQLTKMISDRTIGIDPNYVIAISWIESQASAMLQNMNYENQYGAYKQEWFISLLRFQELIGSPSFDHQQFQSYIKSLSGADTSLEAYKLIARHIFENIRDLANSYKQKGRIDTGALWSGNLVHELVSLMDFKPAQTEQGSKLRNENIRRITEPGYHPGD